MLDLASRLSTRVQFTTDGHKVYLEAVEGAFGNDIDHAEQPFPDRQMEQLRASAMDKIGFWIVERLQADRPTTLAPESN